MFAHFAHSQTCTDQSVIRYVRLPRFNTRPSPQAFTPFVSEIAHPSLNPSAMQLLTLHRIHLQLKWNKLGLDLQPGCVPLLPGQSA